MKQNEETPDLEVQLQQAKQAILRLENDLVNLQAKYEVALIELSQEREKGNLNNSKPRCCKNCVNSALMGADEYFCSIVGRQGVFADPISGGISCPSYLERNG